MYTYIIFPPPRLANLAHGNVRRPGARLVDYPATEPMDLIRKHQCEALDRVFNSKSLCVLIYLVNRQAAAKCANADGEP